MPNKLRTRITDKYPLGLLVILGIAAISSLYILLRPSRKVEEITMWTFIRDHHTALQPVVADWNEKNDIKVSVDIVGFRALKRRMMSGFYSGTPIANILEVERGIASIAWRGPEEAVGFTDLTDILKKEGIYEKVNKPSFSPWTSRGRIYGLPQDVHPIMLCYRADIFEAAGINVEELDTWDKFFAATKKLVKDLDGDGRPDQYVMEMPDTEADILRPLILQAGGGLFDENGKPILNSEINARVMAKCATWAAEPNKLTANAEGLTGMGDKLRIDGYVLSYVTPDWRSRNHKKYLAPLAGKLKMMPLPAWEPGGRRTSAWGGTMIGIPKTCSDFESSWAFTKNLLLTPSLARVFWREFHVVTPVKEFWSDPVFDEPMPFFSNQPVGRMYVNLAEDVPIRSSSPYAERAASFLGAAYMMLVQYANDNAIDDPELLMPKSREYLNEAQDRMVTQMKRNIFMEDVWEESE